MKKYLLFIVLFTFIGCASITFEPVTQPDQRIQLGGFSILPPSGKNWEVTEGFKKKNVSWDTWGRAKWNAKTFKKNIDEPNQASSETEKLFVLVNTYEFALMNFDHDEDLMDFAQSDIKRINKRDTKVLESSSSHEKINGINCIRSIRKVENDSGKRMGLSASAVDIYMQGYECVHPTRLNYIIKLRTNHFVLKGQPPTDFQSELDHFFNSLQFQ